MEKPTDNAEHREVGFPDGQLMAWGVPESVALKAAAAFQSGTDMKAAIDIELSPAQESIIERIQTPQKQREILEVLRRRGGDIDAAELLQITEATNLDLIALRDRSRIQISGTHVHLCTLEELNAEIEQLRLKLNQAQLRANKPMKGFVKIFGEYKCLKNF